MLYIAEDDYIDLILLAFKQVVSHNEANHLND